MEVPPEVPFYKDLQEIKALYQEVQRKSMMRLKHEEHDKDERLSKKGDPYY